MGEAGFAELLSGSGLGVRIGPFDAHMRCGVEELYGPLFEFYRDYPCLGGDRVYSFSVNLQPVRHFKLFGRRRVRFSVDGRQPHQDMPLEHALPVLEWGINLVIAFRGHSFLMLHSAAVERSGSLFLLPAAPGSGKSTLCAALSCRGWRTFSDEFALVRPESGDIHPVPRPMAIKNESIGVIRNFAPDAYIGPVSKGTRKGDVGHVKPPSSSIRRQSEACSASHIVFPRWREGSETTLTRLGSTEAFMLIASNAFNYDLLGEAAFAAVAALVRRSECYGLVYSDLDDATEKLKRLAGKNGS
jgi:HprK-related kinase A